MTLQWLGGLCCGMSDPLSFVCQYYGPQVKSLFLHKLSFFMDYRSGTEPLKNKCTESCLALLWWLNPTLWVEIKWDLIWTLKQQAHLITRMCQSGWKAILCFLQMFCCCCCGMFSVIWMFVIWCFYVHAEPPLWNNEVKPFQNTMTEIMSVSCHDNYIPVI